jgi:hypothetical protein
MKIKKKPIKIDKRKINKNLKRCLCGRFMGWKEKPITCQQCGKSLCPNCSLDFTSAEFDLSTIRIDYNYIVCEDCDKKLEDICDSATSSIDQEGDELEDEEKTDKIINDFQKAFDEQFKKQIDEFFEKRLLAMAIINKT